MKGWILCMVAAAALGGTAPAWSSGADPQDEFVSRKRTDVALDAYANGTLGVVLPTFPRVYLYPAWRAAVLGREGLRAHPVRPGGMKEAVGGAVGDWVGPDHPWNDWLRASQPFVQRPATREPVYRSVSRGDLGQYINCPPDAFRFALANLEALRRRPDAQPARLREWVRAQDQVFEFCDFDPRQPLPAGRKAPAVPEQLAADVPLFWRQWRDYQVAAAHFYDERWEASRDAFARIGATPGHPLQPWGAYLALRSELRLASRIGAEHRGEARPPAVRAARAAALAHVQQQAERILADAGLQPVHEMTRAALRAARFRLVPELRLRELSERLADTAADPTRESALGDWRRLLNEHLDGRGPLARSAEPELRRRHAYFDWIRTVQRCGQAEYEGLEPAPECAASRAHALERWSATRGGERRAWLMAALMLADALPPALEREALQVEPAAPEYLTVRYHLARLYRLGGQPQRARDVAAAVLAGPELAATRSDSARFLFAQERFASAASLEDAAPWLQRTSLWELDADSGETRPFARKEDAVRVAADGRAWVNTRLAVADILALARDARFDAGVRASLTAAAWLRADLLGQADNARAAAQLAQARPAWKDAATAYLAAPDAATRRHLLLLASLRLGLSPELPAGPRWRPVAAWPPRPREEQPMADMWCRLGRAQQPDDDPWHGVEQVPPPPDLAADPAARDRELAALAGLKTATGFLGAHVLARARSHPNDPDLPWLLHVVVLSTRGGCVDADRSQLSRSAWQLLHRRFPDSPWAKKTPYYY